MSTNRIEKLLKQREQIEAQIKAAKAKDRARSRKDDTRRKVIVGALALSHMEHHPEGPFARELQALLLAHVTRPQDRLLLGLDTPQNSGTSEPFQKAASGDGTPSSPGQ